MRRFPSLHQKLTRLGQFPSSSSYKPLSHRSEHYIRHSSSDNQSTTSQATRTEKGTSIATPTTIPAESGPKTTANPRLGLLTTTSRAYTRSQTRHPLWTQFFSALAIYLLADISAQTLSTHDENSKDTAWDIHRTARNLVIGGIASIPGYKWFMFLSRNFNYASSFRSIVTKVVVNQIVFTPVFNTYYFGMACLLSGGNFGQIVQRVRDTVPTSMYNSLFIWPWFQLWNFSFVQAEMRAITSGLFAIGWQAYLSWLNKYAESRRRVQLNKSE